MTAKEYLMQLQTLDLKISQKIDEASQIHSALQGRGVSYDGVHVQTSPQNSQEDTILRCIDMEADINDMISQYLGQKDLIINQIHELGDPLYIQILYMHYVPDERHRVKRLEDIAVCMKKPNGDSYSYDHINRLHGEALQEFDRKILGNDMEMPCRKDV